jgi:hypothetical protein
VSGSQSGVVSLSMALYEWKLGSIESPDDGQGTPETCREVLNKKNSLSDIKLDTHTLYIK